MCRNRPILKSGEFLCCHRSMKSFRTHHSEESRICGVFCRNRSTNSAGRNGSRGPSAWPENAPNAVEASRRFSAENSRDSDCSWNSWKDSIVFPLNRAPLTNRTPPPPGGGGCIGGLLLYCQIPHVLRTSTKLKIAPRKCLFTLFTQARIKTIWRSYSLWSKFLSGAP